MFVHCPAAIALAIACCLATASCDGDSNRDVLDAIDATNDGLDSGVSGVAIELGTGQSSWEDFPRIGAQLELIYGVQGGYHVWGRMRVRGFEPDVDVNYSAVDLTTGRTLRTPSIWSRRRFESNTSFGLAPIGGGVFETDAELVILSIDCAAEVLGHQLQVRVLVRERSSQRIASDVRTGTVIDEVNPTACVMH